MNARDELAKLLFITDNHSPDAERDWLHLKPYGPKYLRGYYDEADAVIAAGYRKIVASRQELDALPTGTKISDNEAEELTKDESGMWTMTAQPHESFSSLEMEFGLPAVVLLEGDEA